MSIKSALKVMEYRDLISGIFNIKNPLNIVFTLNAIETLNIAIKGVLKKENHLISTVIEHNSVLIHLKKIWYLRAEITFVASDKVGYIRPIDIKNEIRFNTKAIIINDASNVLGSVQNIKEIGKIANSTLGAIATCEESCYKDSDECWNSCRCNYW